MRTIAYDVCGNEGKEEIEEVRDGGQNPVEKRERWTSCLSPTTYHFRYGVRKEKSVRLWALTLCTLLDARLARSVERASLTSALFIKIYSPVGPATTSHVYRDRAKTFVQDSYFLIHRAKAFVQDLHFSSSFYRAKAFVQDPLFLISIIPSPSRPSCIDQSNH